MRPAVRDHPTAASGHEDDHPLLAHQTGVLELIAGAAPLSVVLDKILTSLEQLMDGSRCSILLLDRERGTLHHGAAPSLPSTYVDAIDGMAIGDGAGSCGTAAALDVPVVVTDIRHDPRWVDFRRVALAADLLSCWSTPIDGRDGLPVGTFAVYHSRPHRPTPREQLLVDRFTHLAAVAIGHDRLLGDLVESEERLRRSFEGNPLGMLILGPDLVVATSNHAFRALTGDPCGGVGRPLADALVPSELSLAGWLAPLGPAAPGPVATAALLRRTGRPDLEVEVSASLLCAPDDAPAQYVVNVLDLTERRAAERERRARVEAETARRTADELSHAKSALLAAVGHEVRTPIQAVVGFAELLRTIDLDPARRREALDHIEVAAGHVMDLLGDVLDLSRLEAAALPLALERVCLREVVTEVFDLLSATAAARDVALRHHLDGARVRADRRRLRQVLLNLVGNAIRHGHVGGRVDVRSRGGAGTGVVLVAVEDDGPGIPASVQPRLFAPFARADTAGREAGPADEGLGLGLGLAHGLTEAMGGDLRVASTGPGGTAMVLSLARAVASGDAAAPPDPDGPGPTRPADDTEGARR